MGTRLRHTDLDSLRKLVTGLCCLASLLAPGCFEGRVRKGMAFNLRNYDNADSARRVLEQELPKGTTRDKVMSFLKTADIQCFDNEADVLACRVMEKSSTMVHVVWQLAFHFDPKRQLKEILVTRGFVGP
jgi:hypothetical protein